MRYPEETPSFNFKMSFQSNLAFLVAIFILFCCLAWALRDHRRRLLELATEEQEDRLYLTIIFILFLICAMGSYYAFNKHQMYYDGQIVTQNAILAEIQHSWGVFQGWRAAGADTHPPYSPDAAVRMPIPKVSKLEEHLRQRRYEPADEYQGLSLGIFFLIVLVAVWYFYPRPRHEISPPPDYIDAGTYDDRRDDDRR